VEKRNKQNDINARFYSGDRNRRHQSGAIRFVTAMEKIAEALEKEKRR